MVLLSEIAPAAGWVEIYNAGTASVNLTGWQIRTGSSTLVTITSSTALEPYQFYVVAEVGMRLPEEGGIVRLLRPDGSVADSVRYGAVPAQQSISRYPVHGGGWEEGTVLTRGTWNEHAALPSASPTPSQTPPPLVVSSTLAPTVTQPSLPWPVIGLLLALVSGSWVLFKRRKSGSG